VLICRGTLHSTDETVAGNIEWRTHSIRWEASADGIPDKVRRCKELSETGGKIWLLISQNATKSDQVSITGSLLFNEHSYNSKHAGRD